MFYRFSTVLALAALSTWMGSAFGQTQQQPQSSSTAGQLAAYQAEYSGSGPDCPICTGGGAAGGAAATAWGGPPTGAFGAVWGGVAGSRDCNRFLHYPYVYYPQNFIGNEYFRSSDSLYYRYPPEMQIPVYNRHWHNYYPRPRRFHWGHHFITDVF